jgi:rare lipoprotein A
MNNCTLCWVRIGITALLLSLITGCTLTPSWIFDRSKVGDGAPAKGMDISRIQDAIPKPEPRSRSGNPSSYTVLGRTYHVMEDSSGYKERGVASWYGTKFHGKRTSSGEAYNMYAMTAAHKTLPLPTYVRVTNLKNGREAIVKVNDRGPFHDNRLIDLSYAAATKLGISGTGTGLVEVQALDPAKGAAPRPTRNNIAIKGDAILFLQVGAFIDRNNAERLMERLRGAMNNQVRIQMAVNYAQTIYRVQVGPMYTIDQADTTSMQLAQLGIRDMHLVIE